MNIVIQPRPIAEWGHSIKTEHQAQLTQLIASNWCNHTVSICPAIFFLTMLFRFWIIFTTALLLIVSTGYAAPYQAKPSNFFSLKLQNKINRKKIKQSCLWATFELNFGKTNLATVLFAVFFFEFPSTQFDLFCNFFRGYFSHPISICFAQSFVCKKWLRFQKQFKSRLNLFFLFLFYLRVEKLILTWKRFNNQLIQCNKSEMSGKKQL